MRWAIGRSHTCKSQCPLFCHSTAVLRRRACEKTCCSPTLWLHLVATDKEGCSHSLATPNTHALAHPLTCLIDCLLSYWLARCLFQEQDQLPRSLASPDNRIPHGSFYSSAKWWRCAITPKYPKLLHLSNRSSALRWSKHDEYVCSWEVGKAWGSSAILDRTPEETNAKAWRGNQHWIAQHQRWSLLILAFDFTRFEHADTYIAFLHDKLLVNAVLVMFRNMLLLKTIFAPFLLRKWWPIIWSLFLLFFTPLVLADLFLLSYADR